jgi:hypothetical protein
MDDIEVRGIAWSNFNQVDTLTRNLPFRTRVCACNAKPTGVFCTCCYPTFACNERPCCSWKFINCLNTPGAQCLGLFISLLFVLIVCSFIPTMLGMIPTAIIAHFLVDNAVVAGAGAGAGAGMGGAGAAGAAGAGASAATASTSTAESQGLASTMTALSQHLALGALAHLMTLLARLPWLSFKRTVYSKSISLLRTLFHPRAMLTTLCSILSSILLYYVYSTTAGVGLGLPPGVRGGTGDHVWGQMIYMCPMWGGGGGGGGGGNNGNNGNNNGNIHTTCVNNAQWLSVVSAVTAGWLHAHHYLISEKYVLSLSSVQRRRFTRLLPKIAVEAIRGWKLALISVGIAYMIGDVCLSRGTKWLLVMKSMEYLHGSSGVSGPGTIINFFIFLFSAALCVCRRCCLFE